jgi:hypothetical protein
VNKGEGKGCGPKFEQHIHGKIMGTYAKVI